MSVGGTNGPATEPGGWSSAGTDWNDILERSRPRVACGPDMATWMAERQGPLGGYSSNTERGLVPVVAPRDSWTPWDGQMKEGQMKLGWGSRMEARSMHVDQNSPVRVGRSSETHG